MGNKLTRRGARNVTSTIDDMASLVQHHFATLGIPEEIALDWAKKSDTISDLVELTAAANFPVASEAPEFGKGEGESPETAGVSTESGGTTNDSPASKDLNKPMSQGGKEAAVSGVNETGESLPNANGGFPADAIGDKKSGPLEGDADEAYMKGHFTSEDNSELRGRQESGSLPKVDARLAKVLASLDPESLLVLKAASAILRTHLAASDEETLSALTAAVDLKAEDEDAKDEADAEAAKKAGEDEAKADEPKADEDEASKKATLRRLLAEEEMEDEADAESSKKASMFGFDLFAE